VTTVGQSITQSKVLYRTRNDRIVQKSQTDKKKADDYISEPWEYGGDSFYDGL